MHRGVLNCLHIKPLEILTRYHSGPESPNLGRHHLLLVPLHPPPTLLNSSRAKAEIWPDAMNVRQAQTLVNDNDELIEPQDT